ncbi:MAG: hypothetical protein HY516_02370 [Candidatus Aenigmarchaeota archaeon]|nr:hypothetical protein [Candidatus Aenigmarchaeota archaeon]
MKLFKGRGSGSVLDYKNQLKEAEKYLNAAEKAATGYLRSVGKGKRRSDDPAPLIAADYSMASINIEGLRDAAKTAKEKDTYQKLRDRLERVSGTVAKALETGAMDYVSSAREFMETGDRIRIDDEIRDERNRKTSEDSEARLERDLEARGEVGKLKVAGYRAQREQRKRDEEERLARFGGAHYSNSGYSTASQLLTVADSVLDYASKAAENSGAGSLTGEIESAKSVVADARKDLESRRKSGK